MDIFSLKAMIIHILQECLFSDSFFVVTMKQKESLLTNKLSFGLLTYMIFVEEYTGIKMRSMAKEQHNT